MKLLTFISKWLRNHRLIPVINNRSITIYNEIRFHHAEMRRWMLEHELLTSSEAGVTSAEIIKGKQLIVSLTSYGRRLWDVPYTIQSIMRQTQKPNRIILWLDEADKNNIPIALSRLCKRGLEIRVTPENIRSYKKLIPALREFPNDIVVTVDDDIFYEIDLLERLVNASKQHPNTICACRCHRIEFDQNNKILPYNAWKWNHQISDASDLNFLTGVGGVLYPPNTLDPEVSNETAFMTLAPTADDVWFYCMALKNKTKIFKVTTRHIDRDDYIENYVFHFEGLSQNNVINDHQNDCQIQHEMSHYKLNLTDVPHSTVNQITQ